MDAELSAELDALGRSDDTDSPDENKE